MALTIVLCLLPLGGQAKEKPREPYQTQVVLAQGVLLAQPSKQVSIETSKSYYDIEQERLARLKSEKAKRISYYGSSEVIGYSNEQCVIYARRVTGNTKVKGYAGNLQPEGYEPQIGAVALEAGHASVVVGINGDKVVLNEANYISGRITQRVVMASSIKGFIY